MNPQMMAELLRQKAALNAQAGKASDQAQIYGSQFQDPNFAIATPGYSTNIGGSQAQMPGQVQVNYGDIIGKGVSNYMQAKGLKEARELKAKGDEISQMFMQDTLSNDPEAQKLYGAAQAGIKGAGEALMQRIAPKKEALAGLIQGVTSGSMTEQMARELAPRYGIDPEVAAATARHAAEAAEKKRLSEVGSKMTLQQMKDAAAQSRLDQQLESRERTAATTALARPVRETEAQKLNARKNMEFQEIVDNADPAIQQYDDLIKLASEAKYLPMGLGLAPGQINPKGLMLKQAIPALVLARTGGKLGAGISNADVAFLERSIAELEKGSADTVIAQLKFGREHLANERAKARRKLGLDADSTNAAALPDSKYDYTGSKKREASEALPSFEDIMKEFE